MQEVDAIIFDIDGTLWDARDRVTAGWNRAYTAYTGKPGWLTLENFASHFGVTIDCLIRIAFPGITDEEIPQVYNLCSHYQKEAIQAQPGKLYPGVKETLIKLAQTYRLFILSNCTSEYINDLLDSHGLRGYFEGWICYGDNHQPKDVNLRILSKRFGLRHPVYVGDIQADADSCERAGVPIIFASYGLGTIQHPVATLTKFSDLLEIFL